MLQYESVLLQPGTYLSHVPKVNRSLKVLSVENYFSKCHVSMQEWVKNEEGCRDLFSLQILDQSLKVVVQLYCRKVFTHEDSWNVVGKKVSPCGRKRVDDHSLYRTLLRVLSGEFLFKKVSCS